MDETSLERTGHVTQDDLEAVLRGERSAEWLGHRYLHHSLTLCAVCREEYRAFRDAHGGSAGRAGAMLEAIGRLRRELEEMEERAEEDLEVLLRLPTGRRSERVSRARSRFRSPLLAERLLEVARERMTAEPREARDLARLAFHVTTRCDDMPPGGGADLLEELRVRAMAYEANALRAGGDVRAADGGLTAALDQLDALPLPLERAEVLSFGASLRRAQRRFPEALRLIDRAVALYEEQGETHLAGRARVTRAHVLNHMGEPGRALETLEAALEGIDRGRDQRLALSAHHTRACSLCDLGRHGEARQVLEAHADLYAAFPDPPTRLRRRWPEAKVARGLGELEEAERAFVEVREGFLEWGSGYDAALAALDLALLYADEGRSAEMRRLARAMAPVFRAQDVHREALAALLLFVEAAGREEADRRLVEHLTDYLHRARHDPRLRYGAGG